MITVFIVYCIQVMFSSANFEYFLLYVWFCWHGRSDSVICKFRGWE